MLFLFSVISFFIVPCVPETSLIYFFNLVSLSFSDSVTSVVLSSVSDCFSLLSISPLSTSTKLSNFGYCIFLLYTIHLVLLYTLVLSRFSLDLSINKLTLLFLIMLLEFVALLGCADQYFSSNLKGFRSLFNQVLFLPFLLLSLPLCICWYSGFHSIGLWDLHSLISRFLWLRNCNWHIFKFIDLYFLSVQNWFSVPLVKVSFQLFTVSTLFLFFIIISIIYWYSSFGKMQFSYFHVLL